jgi:YHS domain-containing protein
VAEYTWCHGPNCHERRTTNRVRGVKGNKVLRTVKMSRDSQWEYFCDQTCLHDFIRKHWQEFVRLHPRTEALETPVTVEKNIQDN